MKLYIKYLAIHIKSQMQYKVSFYLMMAGYFVVSFSMLLGVYFMMSRFNTVDGFTFEEVLIGAAVTMAGFAIGEGVARAFDMFPVVISNGEFDRMLVRPRGLIFQVMAAKLELSRLGYIAQAAVVLCYAVPASGIVWTADKIITLILMIVCGGTVFCCLFLIYAALSFFTIEGLEFMNVFTDGGREFGRYPFSIYGKEVLKILTYVVPMALFQYYPLLYLIGRETGRFYMFLPLLSLLFVFPAYGLWRLGLRNYKSTGS
ncbi:MAG TPA: ABC-2 family transporter protein [Candidatus Limiplasma sp.]|nr:ABC-2 family transporter protein [Candidatus Limiplasma sp.]